MTASIRPAGIAALFATFAIVTPVHAQKVLDKEPAPGKLKAGECVLVKRQPGDWGNCPKVYEACGSADKSTDRIRKCRRDIK